MAKIGASGCSGIAFLVFFTLFWCGIVGVFVSVQIGTAWRIIDARQRYQVVTGTLVREVEADKVRRSAVSYRYVVADHVYTGERVGFGAMGKKGEEDRRRLALVVRHLPEGDEVRVYYDPRDPRESALDLGWPGQYWFIWLFLQPFLLVGLALISALVLAAWAGRTARRCRAGGWAAGWAVPGWGVVAATDDGPALALGGRLAWGEVAATVLITHGLFSFAALFVLALLGGMFKGSAGGEPWSMGGLAVATTFLLSFATGALVVRYRRRRLRRPLLRIDPVAQTVALTSAEGDLVLPWSAISAWELMRGTVTGDGDSGDLVLFLTPLGQAPIRLRAWSDHDLARHVASELGRATRVLVRYPG